MNEKQRRLHYDHIMSEVMKMIDLTIMSEKNKSN